MLFCLLQTSLPAQDTTRLFAQIQDRSRAALQLVPADERGNLSMAYRSRDAFLMEQVRDSAFLFDTLLQPYLDTLVRRVIRINDLPLSPLVFVDPSREPNARSLGTGIIAVNLGLLLAHPAEEELLFVLSHEIAHDQLGHHAAALREGVTRHTEINTTLRKLSRPGLFRSDRKERQLNVDLRNEYYGVFRLKRNAELQADSLALRYFERLGHPAGFASNALGERGAREEESLHPRALVDLLASADCPIADSWLTPRAKLFGSGSFGKSESSAPVQAFWQTDSLDTHPALADRRVAMKDYLSGGEVQSPSGFTPHPLMREVRIAIIEGELATGRFGTALVAALHLLHQQPSEPAHRDLVARALLGVYSATRNHEFDEAVPPTAYFAEPAHQRVIEMLRQISLADLRKLTGAYLSTSAPGIYAASRNQFTLSTEE